MRQYTRKPVADKVLPIVRAVFDEQDRKLYILTGLLNRERQRNE